MSHSLRSLSQVTRPQRRPNLEGLEDRITPVLGAMNLPIEVADINVVGTATNPALEAVISLAGQATDTVTANLTTTDDPNSECPILTLELGPIDLNLLGLGVETSRICLDITAVNDQGLLGGLLCDLTNGLNLGGVLSKIGMQLDNLLDRLDGLLDQILGGAMPVTGALGAPGGVAAHQEGVCDILNLSLGPVDLKVPLLGVNVSLDNCEGGPVTVDVTGDPEGGLLGDLLCGLAGGIDTGGIDLGGLVSRLDSLIDRLGDLADAIDRLPELTNQIENLLDRLERLAGRIDDLRDLDRLIDQIDRAIDRIERVIDRLG